MDKKLHPYKLPLMKKAKKRIKTTPKKKVSMNTHPCVKNIQGHAQSELGCACRSWIAHWRNFTGSSRTSCAVLKCSSKAIHGAHVISIDKRKSNHRYIVPMCATHNNSNNTKGMFLDSRILLIKANKNATCKKVYY